MRAKTKLTNPLRNSGTYQKLLKKLNLVESLTISFQLKETAKKPLRIKMIQTDVLQNKKPSNRSKSCRESQSAETADGIEEPDNLDSDAKIGRK